jgi:hypothetical protein
MGNPNRKQGSNLAGSSFNQKPKIQIGSKVGYVVQELRNHKRISSARIVNEIFEKFPIWIKTGVARVTESSIAGIITPFITGSKDGQSHDERKVGFNRMHAGFVFSVVRNVCSEMRP